VLEVVDSILRAVGSLWKVKVASGQEGFALGKSHLC
jgi:hypothetical protein